MNINRSILSLVLLVAGFGSNVAAQSPPETKSYDLKLRFENSQLLVESISVENFAAPDRRVQPQNGWICDIVSVDGQTISSFKFSIPLITCSDQSGAAGNLEGGCQSGGSADFDLIVPYYTNGAALIVYSPAGVEAFNVDTLKFADLCGDNVCEAGENRLTCAKDCRSGVKDGVCDMVKDGTCDQDCVSKADSDCAADSQSLPAYLLVAAGLALAALTGFVLWQAKGKRKSPAFPKPEEPGFSAGGFGG